MSEGNQNLDGIMAGVLEEMPEGPMAGRLATLVGSCVRASGLPPESAWCAVAAIASAAHGDGPAFVAIAVPGEEEGERKLYRFHANGEVSVADAVEVGTVEPPTKH